MRVLVTGHLGYLGTRLTPFLLARGFDVVGIDSDLYEDCGFPLRGPIVPTLHAADVRDVTTRDLAGIDAIVHLAALCNDPLGDLDREVTLAINHRATLRLATLARDAGVKRFLFSSSCSIYGATGNGSRVAEDAPLQPLTPYAESKARSEEGLSRLAGRDFAPVYLRNGTAYGLSDRLRGDVVLNNLVGWAHTTGRIRLMSDGLAWRPLVHVEDIARACVACLEAPLDVIRDQAFNIGADEENYLVRELAEIVRETVPGCAVEYAEGSSPDRRSYRVDFGKATRLLPGFQPAWTARRGAAEMSDALAEAEMDQGTYFGHRFIRLLQIKRLREHQLVDGALRRVAAEVSR
jgi:nucleoside-diphosphate-sugar epimerase